MPGRGWGGPYPAAVRVEATRERCDMTGWAVDLGGGPETGTSVAGLAAALTRGGDAIAYADDLADTGSAMICQLLAAGYRWADGAPRRGGFTACVGRSEMVLGIRITTATGSVWLYGLDTRGAPAERVDPSGPPLERLGACRDRMSAIPDGLGGMTLASAAWRGWATAYGRGRLEHDAPPLAPEDYQWLHEAYRPGLSYARPGHCTGRALTYYDIHAAYPYQLATARLPYGPPTRGAGEPPRDGFWVCELTLNYLLRSRRWPHLTDLGETHRATRPHRDGETRTIRLSSIEWESVQDSYQTDVLAWGRWLWWPTRPAPSPASAWIGRWIPPAGGAPDWKVAAASLAGRYGRGPRGTTRRPRLDALGELRWDDVPLDTPRPAAGLPVAIAVVDAQRARMLAIRRWVRRNHGRCLHRQTDGVLVEWEKGRPPRMPDRLGLRSGLGRWRAVDVSEARVWQGGQWAYRAAVDGRVHAHVGYVPEDVWADAPSLAPGGLPPMDFEVRSRVSVPGGDWVRVGRGRVDPEVPGLYTGDGEAPDGDPGSPPAGMDR